MKKIAILGALLLLNVGVFAKSTGGEPSYIEVRGESEVVVTPNEFVVEITIDEAATKGVRSVAETEAKMKKALASVGVDVSSSLKIANLQSRDLRRAAEGSAVLYSLELESYDMLIKSFNELNKVGVTAVNLVSATHSDIKKYCKEARAEAVANGREVASDIAEALGQKLGGAVTVTNVNTYLYSGSPRMVSFAEGRSAADNALEFKDTKVHCSMTIRYSSWE